jgi:hypothetical protein
LTLNVSSLGSGVVRIERRAVREKDDIVNCVVRAAAASKDGESQPLDFADADLPIFPKPERFIRRASEL